MWAKIRAALKRVARLEPVAVQAIIRAVFMLAATLGLSASEEVQGRAFAAVAAGYALAELLGAAWARTRVTPSARVVEAIDDAEVVVAGPANDRVPTGHTVRYLDDRPV